MDIDKLSQLANLTLTEEEKKTLSAQLEETLSYFKNLEELDTKNVEPTDQVTSLENVTFADGTENTRALHIDKYYTVNRIMEE